MEDDETQYFFILIIIYLYYIILPPARLAFMLDVTSCSSMQEEYALRKVLIAK